MIFVNFCRLEKKFISSTIFNLTNSHSAKVMLGDERNHSRKLQ